MVEPALGRIAFVTRHYATLRGGVARAIWGPCLIAGGVIEAFFNSGGGLGAAVFGVTNIFLWSGLGVALWLWSRQWLDQRFGRVRSKNPLLPLSGLFVCQMGFFVASRLDDFNEAGSGFPSATFLFVAAVGLWFCIRLWPRSLHYLVPTAVAVGFALRYASLSGEQSVDLWVMKAYGTSLLAWTAAGLIDLMMLFKAMPQRAQEAPMTADA